MDETGRLMMKAVGTARREMRAEILADIEKQLDIAVVCAAKGTDQGGYSRGRLDAFTEALNDVRRMRR